MLFSIWENDNNIYCSLHIFGLPSWLSGKEPACQYRRHSRRGFSPWVGKIPWRRKWQPMPVILPGKIPWTEEPERLQSMGSQIVGHDWAGPHALTLLLHPHRIASLSASHLDLWVLKFLHFFLLRPLSPLQDSMLYSNQLTRIYWMSRYCQASLPNSLCSFCNKEMWNYQGQRKVSQYIHIF